MKIFLTKKEYRLLVDILYLSDWMMHSHLSVPDKKHAGHVALRKKLLSYYKQMDADDLVTYSTEMGEYFETRNHEDKAHAEFIDKYDEEIFWEELMSRLAARDLISSMGVEKYKAMPGLERAAQLETIEQSYAMEFEHYGLERIKIVDKPTI